jgi:hypothetical protein
LGPAPSGVDTARFIYLIEEDTRFLPHVRVVAGVHRADGRLNG